MIQIVWEYRVRPEKVIHFESNYASAGTWAQLFQKSRAYRGTVLIRDAETPHRYLTVDVWTDRAAYESFRAEHAKEYEEIDHICAEFTLDEKLVGIFEIV